MRKQQFYVWWFRCIGLAFLLLAVRSAIRGDTWWGIAIRVAIGVAFFVLARETSRQKPPT